MMQSTYTLLPITMEVENGPQKETKASHLPFAPIFHGTMIMGERVNSNS